MDTALTRDQVRRVDALAIDELGIPGVVLMENAGANATRIILERYPDSYQRRYVIVCGTGNNGGDGFVIARHLHNAGATIMVRVCGHPERMAPDAQVHGNIVFEMGVDLLATDHPLVTHILPRFSADDVIIDAIFGTGFHGAVRRPLAKVIAAMNAAPRHAMVAIDVPSGLDCDTGKPADSTIRADLTITFVANKVGFLKPAARPYVGEVVVAGIGAPPELIDRVLQTDGP